MSLTEAVDRSIAALETGQGPTELDLGLAELSRVLAHELDAVRAISARADQALAIARDTQPENETLHDLIESLRSRLAERTALDRIGGRLLGCFVELGATPRSRGAAKAPAGPAAGGALGKLRGITGGQPA